MNVYKEKSGSLLVTGDQVRPFPNEKESSLPMDAENRITIFIIDCIRIGTDNSLERIVVSPEYLTKDCEKIEI